MSGRYFGVDGCAGGWALVELVGGRPVMHLFVAEFAGVLERTKDARLVLVDIPIGLADAARGERRCDVLARKVLGDRGSCVFPAPIREVVDLPERCTQAEASARQRQLTGRGLTMQAYCLLPKIREVDSLMRQNPRLQETVRESHPELCFAALNGGNPVQHGKLSQEGRPERLRSIQGDGNGLKEESEYIRSENLQCQENPGPAVEAGSLEVAQNNPARRSYRQPSHTQ
ncbi:MAG: DUF429 domain-containing protein [Bacillota bacterium]|nr:DUF429 domain-containing protein [Bacillota bacterium]